MYNSASEAFGSSIIWTSLRGSLQTIRVGTQIYKTRHAHVDSGLGWRSWIHGKVYLDLLEKEALALLASV